MAIQSPGVVFIEKDNSVYTQRFSNSIMGMVITATKGPLNTPVLVSGEQDFIYKFGAPTAEALGALSAIQYLKKGQNLVCVRVAGPSVLTSGVTVKDVHGTPVLDIMAKSPGTWTDGITVNVTNVNLHKFRLQVLKNNSVLESIECSMLQTDSNYVEKITKSSFVVMNDLTDGVSIPRPVLASGIYELSQGHDGISARKVSPRIDASVELKCTALDNFGIPVSAVRLTSKLPGTTGNHLLAKVSNVSANYFDISIMEDVPTFAFGIVKNTSNVDVLKVATKATGSTLPDYDIVISNAVNDVFDLTIKNRATNAVVETYTGCSSDASSADYVMLKTAGSALFNVSYLIGIGSQLVAGTTQMAGNSDYTTLEFFPHVSLIPTSIDSVVSRLSGSGYVKVVVLVDRLVTMLANPAAPFANGYDGSIDELSGVSDSSFIGTSPTEGLQVFTNSETMLVDFIAVPGASSNAVIGEGISLCERRGDCVFIIDPPFGLTYNEVIDWHNGSGAYLDRSSINSSFAAIYWPWLKTYDAYTKQDVWLPPSGFVGGIYANTDLLGDAWAAPAGYTRGRILEATELEYSPNQAERDMLYGNGNVINPIVNFTRDGITVFGQRTAQRTPSATDRLSVRRMMCAIRKSVTDTSKYFIFESNSEFTWRRWVDTISDYLEVIRRRGGIIGYEVQMDSNTVLPANIDRYEMPGKISILPDRKAEIITIETTLRRFGDVSFVETYNSSAQ